MNKEVLAIIPARGGSKALPRKNIKKLNGIPLIAYTLLAANKSKYIKRIVVSTDDNEIAYISKTYGGEIPYIRPSKLADDTSPTIDSILHMIDYLEKKQDYCPDYILLLQCTSPLRNTQHIDEAIEKLLNSDFDGIASICEAEVNPYWTNVLTKDKLQYFIKEGKQITRRQDLPEIYRCNGAIFLAKTEVLKKEKTFELENLTGYIMDEYSSIDIDTELDFKIAEVIMNTIKANERK